MREYSHPNIKDGDVVAVRSSSGDGSAGRLWMVLDIDRETMFHYGLNMSKAGLCAFGGPWYRWEDLVSLKKTLKRKRSLLDHRSYGKILELRLYAPRNVIKVFDNVREYSPWFRKHLEYFL